MSLDLIDRPLFADPDDAARAAHSGLRRRLMDGAWADDAATRHQQFFGAETASFLPPPDLSHNAFLLFVDAKSTLYDIAPRARPVLWEELAEGAPDPTAAVVTPELWALCQENLRYVNGLNENLMRVDVIDGKVSYRVVHADCVGGVIATAGSPDRPVGLTELRPRSRVVGNATEREYTFETWSIADPANPVFKIEAYRVGADGKKHLADVTAEYYRDATGQPAQGYPYRDRANQPILPYVLYHAKVGNTIWNAWAGMEVVEGTLTVSSLWTFWLMGARDGAHPQRYTFDAEVDGAVTSAPDGQLPTGYVQLIPTAILRFKSKGDRQGSASQFQPAMDTQAQAAANLDYEAALGRFAGIDAPDIQRTAGASGYALVVSQDGKRKAQQRLETPCRRGDLLLLATASRMANALLGTKLPEQEALWTIEYAKGRRSIEEIKAEGEHVKLMRELGVYDDVDVMMYLNPHMSQHQAAQAVIEKRKVRAMLAKAEAALMVEEMPSAGAGADPAPPPQEPT